MGSKKDILVIGDAHARPGIPNDRFTWLGKWAREKRPDIIVDMGDWEDMPSLSSYDFGKSKAEGRRYLKDIEAACDAREKFNQALKGGAGPKSLRDQADYNPTKIALGGNHAEGRIQRITDENPRLIGALGVKDLEHEAYGWEYVPYLTPVFVQGFAFCHYFASGVKGLPIGGEMPSLSLLRKQFHSTVAGHSHLFDVSHRTLPNGRRIWGLVAGCFLAENQWEDYAKQANKMWWKGAILLRGCKDGDIDSFETISLRELKAKYE